MGFRRVAARTVFGSLNTVSQAALRGAVRSTIRLGYDPFVVQFKPEDVEPWLNFLTESERIPTVARGMSALGMSSLVEWYWNKHSIAQRPSPYSHPLLKPYVFFPGLEAKTFFDTSAFPWVRDLEGAYDEIRDEVMNALEAKTGFQPYRNIEAGHLAQNWNMLHFQSRGKRIEQNAALCPTLVEILESIPGQTPHGFVALSALNPGRHILPHYGAMNGLLRMHFGVVGCDQKCFIRVGNDIDQWANGKVIIFDDSFEHQVVHNGDRTRIVAWLDVKHPSWPDEDYARWLELLQRYVVDLKFFEDLEKVGQKDREVLAEKKWWAA